VKILLDTHVWIWSQEMPERLGPVARGAIADEANELYVSAASTLEISRLLWGGRLALAGRPATWVCSSLEALLAETIPLTNEISMAAYDLSGEFHRDPIDRILVATATVHDLTLATADERILAYAHVLSLDAQS